jgi:DNA-binding CsgD family transcriptional regulator
MVEGEIAGKAPQKSKLAQLTLLSFFTVAALSHINAGVWGNLRFGGIAITDPLPIIIACLSVFIAAPVSYMVFRQSLRKPTALLYCLPLVIIMAAFAIILFLESLALPALSDRRSMFPLYFVGYFSEATLFFAILSTAKVFKLSLIRIGGFAYSVMWLMAFIWSLFFEWIPNLPGVFILFGTLAGVVVLTVTSSKSNERGLPQVERCNDLAIAHELTKREIEILHLLAQGRSVPRIRKELYLAEGTVRNHITHIYRKLGIRTRQELFDLLQ